MFSVTGTETKKRTKKSEHKLLNQINGISEDSVKIAQVFAGSFKVAK